MIECIHCNADTNFGFDLWVLFVTGDIGLSEDSPTPCADGLLDQCMREGQESRASFGDFCLHGASECAARKITFHSLISACEKGKSPEQALEIFASMEHQRVQPIVSSAP